MRHLRPIVLATVAVALCAAPVAAHDRHGAVVTPANAKLVSEGWAQLYGLPLAENPWAGNGDDPCVEVGRDMIVAVNGGPCTIKYGTALMLGWSTGWSNAEDPNPQTEAEQRALALDADRPYTKITVKVDRDRPVDILRRRFELFTRQRTVQLPEDNILDGYDPDFPEVPARPITSTAHGWMALVRNLRPGPHKIVLASVYAGDLSAVTFDITVVRR